jgi:moderate conductance mechanosensitive channel
VDAIHHTRRVTGALAGALWLVALLISLLADIPPVRAQTAAPTNLPPKQIQELLHLLEEPSVREWINQQQQAAPVPPEAAPEATVSERLSTRIAQTREHLASLVAAVPNLPREIRHAADLLSQEIQHRRLIGIVLLVLGFLTLGAGTEWIFAKATAPSLGRVLALPMDTASERVRTVLLRFAIALAHLAIFAVGSIGAFLVLEWPPLLKQVVLAYLIAALMLRLALVAGRFLLAPRPFGDQDTERFRIIPMTTGTARFWYRRLALFVGWFAFGWATVSVMRSLELSLPARELVAYTLGIGLLVIAIEAVWRWPRALPSVQESPESRARHHALGAWLLTVYLVVLWGLWVAGLMGLFWLAVVGITLPQAVTIASLSSRHLLRPGHEAEAASDQDLGAIYLDRGLRALLVVGAALLLAHAWGIDLVELTSRDTLLTRLAGGVLSSVVILLIADLIWQIVKSQIDRRLSQTQASPAPGSDEALRQARLRTLLPIFRNAVLVVLAAVAVLMVLSALGVEIGPLIAGAGVVGVAVGFGSQTLVKDIISGIFYLLDDAFRVGEYIQSGSYKGTVESLGFRSVKLRHHRGYLYTVPYGQLGAVENMSRDWVIDKMTLNVTYDTDLDKAKKIIKQIGNELAQDPEFAPNIIEPLKMQGVEQFGDFAIQLRMKIMTRPGEQFVIRRRAYALIKKAFDENGIRFALPTVQVAGRDDVEPAAARQVLTLIKNKPPGESG